MKNHFKFISIIYALLLCIILYYNNFFFLPDYDTAKEIIYMYHNEIWMKYPHHQLIIPYYKLFFWLLSFINDDYNKFILIFLTHYFFGLIVIWKIIEFLSNNQWIAFLYYISISISGIVLFNILTFEDGIITFPFYLLSFYLFILFYDSKKINLLIFSAMISGFSVSINSSDFFLVVGICGFFGIHFIYEIYKNKKYINIYIFYLLIYLISFFSILLILLSIKSYIGNESLITLIKYTFLSPHIIYKGFLGEFGITIPRIIKTMNMFSFILIQDSRFFYQLNFNIIIYNFVIILILIYAVWTIRDYKPVVVILIVLFINIYILLTSNETAINERLFNTIFLFIILIRSKKWIPIFFGLIFIFSIFNLKHYMLANEIKDKLTEVSKKEVKYLTIYHFYNDPTIQNYINKKIDEDQFLANSSVPALGYTHLILKQNCFVYNPYRISFPYLPQNCKFVYDLNFDQPFQNDHQVYIDPYLKETLNSYQWNCENLKLYLEKCNHDLLPYIPSKDKPFKDNIINNACNMFLFECVQKMQFYCNYLYYCRKDYFSK